MMMVRSSARSTDTKVKAAVAAIKAELCGGDYHDASGWKTSAHTNISDAHGNKVSVFVTTGNNLPGVIGKSGDNEYEGFYDILTQLRHDFIETLGRRAPTIRLTIPSGGSASSFSMAITDPGTV